MQVRVVAMRDGADADTWDMTVGKTYMALPKQFNRGDFDFIDDAGDRQWARLEDDPVAVWEVVEE